MKEKGNVKNKTYLNNKLERNQTKNLIPILQQKWKYLQMWNKILLQKEIVHKQLISKRKQIKKKECQKQNISRNKLERSDQKANTNISAEIKISQNLKTDTSWKRNSEQTVDIENKTNKEKECQKQNISRNKIERSDLKANTNTSAEMKLFYNLKQDTYSG